ncbi:MAG: DNA polymerase/3'-5' exonuclease PolX [Methanobacteriota archaeon]|nr:MAG: DNA polymerase/3'-5' exonuclease PolX [Euryarchaeota archaeon]
MGNPDVARIFYEVADLLELQGVSFKPQAYRRAAAAIEQLEVDIADAVREGRHKEIPGVGAAIAKKIEEIVDTGRLAYLDELKSEVPAGLLEVLMIPDVGPKTAMQLHRELGISSVAELKEAVESHRLQSLKGFGAKTEERILLGIRTLESSGGRTLLGEARPVARAYLAHVMACVPDVPASICGSLRRGRDTIGDIDILVASDSPDEVSEAFASYGLVSEVLARGSTKSSVLLQNGLQVDLRVVEASSYGAALQYFTGSKEHNVIVRKIGVERGLKVNEYGVFERGTERPVAGDSEESVYEALGLPWIPPELREDAGEVSAALDGKLPSLVDASDIRGDFHIHTDWSDGSDTIEEIASAAANLGYEFVAITDHSQSLTIANGLSPEKLRRQLGEIGRVGDKHADDITVFSGSEVDIKPDGSLDFPSSLLRELDVVIASIHSKMKMPKADMTKRMTKALESGDVDILGHPTARIIGRREPVEVDLEEIFEVAADAGVAMEVNAFPDRLDLRDVHCRLAKEHGVPVAIGTDSHSVRHLEYLELGTITARRGWLEKGDVLNTFRPNDIRKRLSGRRS